MIISDQKQLLFLPLKINKTEEEKKRVWQSQFEEPMSKYIKPVDKDTLIVMEVPWEGVVSGSGPPAVLPRQRWLRLNLRKRVVARLHITYQSMCAILLDKLNKLLLFLCHGAKIDSICEGFPKAVQVIFLGTSTEIYRAKQPWGHEGDHIVLLITQI